MFWERINRSAGVIQILQAFGLWDGLAALFVGVLEFTLAEHAGVDVPGWVLFPVILFTMVCVLWLRNAYVVARRLREPRPDYDRYRGRQSFTTWEAAALWADQPNNTPRLYDFGYEMFTLLKRELTAGRVRGEARNVAGDFNRASEIPVEELRLFATRRGERPKFLFQG
jgi:hypothetical protein